MNEGGKEFLVYVEDSSNPSLASSPDHFWFTVLGKLSDWIAVLSSRLIPMNSSRSRDRTAVATLSFPILLLAISNRSEPGIVKFIQGGDLIPALLLCHKKTPAAGNKSSERGFRDEERERGGGAPGQPFRARNEASAKLILLIVRRVVETCLPEFLASFWLPLASFWP